MLFFFFRAVNLKVIRLCIFSQDHLQHLCYTNLVVRKVQSVICNQRVVLNQERNKNQYIYVSVICQVDRKRKPRCCDCVRWTATDFQKSTAPLPSQFKNLGFQTSSVESSLFLLYHLFKCFLPGPFSTNARIVC